MKTTIYLITICLIAFSCSKDTEFLKSVELDKPNAMIVMCQGSTEDTLWRIDYEYENDKLISESKFYQGALQEKITYAYESEKLVLEIYTSENQKTEKTFIYNELNQLTNVLYKFTTYNSSGQVTDIRENEAAREYENNKLVKEWEYWGGYNTYEYRNGKVVTSVNYTQQGEKYHITTFKYSGDLLTEEIKVTKTGNLIYFKVYKYDSLNRLSKIIDRGNIIEKNTYVDYNLIEKRTYYFGIDPCFSACCGNFVMRYEY